MYGSGQVNAVMCPYTDYWQTTISNIASQLVNDYGTSGAYIDQIGASSARLCADSSHGHSLGGGNYWVSGYHKLLEQTFAKASIKGNLPVFVSECNVESFMNRLSGNLMWNFYGNGYIPMYSAIYGGYSIMFGRTFTDGDLDPDPISFTAKIGQMFIFGAQLGWFNQYQLVDGSPNHTLAMNYVKKLATYRTNSLEYLLYGRLLRPLNLQLLPDMKTFQVLWGGTVTLPLVMESVWAGDQSLGILLTNVSPWASQSLNFNIDLSLYDFVESGAQYQVMEVNENGKATLIGTYPGPIIPFSFVMNGLDVFMFKIVAVK